MASLTAMFPSATDFLQAFEQEISKGGLLIRNGTLPNATAMASCELELQVGAEPPLLLAAKIAAVIPNVGIAVMFESADPRVAALVAKLKSPAPEGEGATESSATLSEQLKTMTVPQKMQLALSGDRQVRHFLLRDTNKVLHLYVLKNPRIGLDEVQAAAKMPSCSSEALKFISESADWGKSGAICAALAKNPSMPIPLVVKLLPRVPMPDLKLLAKGGARQPIVQAARKLMNG